MNVYILKQNFYNYDCAEEPTSVILGAYTTRKKAIEERRKNIVDNVLNYGFIPDEELKGKDTKTIDLITLFWNFQENWKNYIELEIIEKEIE